MCRAWKEASKPVYPARSGKKLPAGQAPAVVKVSQWRQNLEKMGKKTTREFHLS